MPVTFFQIQIGTAQLPLVAVLLDEPERSTIEGFLLFPRPDDEFAAVETFRVKPAAEDDTDLAGHRKLTRAVLFARLTQRARDYQWQTAKWPADFLHLDPIDASALQMSCTLGEYPGLQDFRDGVYGSVLCEAVGQTASLPVVISESTL
jgi:hypothetical protein